MGIKKYLNMLSIVIPLFNEELVLEILFQRIISASKTWDVDEFEVVFVDDGSTDNTKNILIAACEEHVSFKYISLSRNFGHQAAITAGLSYVSGDEIAIMDGDLQDPPEELNGFLKKLREGYDVVYAIRGKRKENIIKRFFYYSFYRILKSISDVDMPLDAGDFCVMSGRMVSVLNNELTERNRFIRGLRAFAGYKQVGIPYERMHRAAGIPKYNLSKLIRLAFDGLIDFSSFPLRVATYIGTAVAFSSLCIGVFFVIHRLLNFKIFGYSPADMPGMASLAVGVFFLGGVNLIIMGVLGEYIGRIYIEVKKRPSYFVIDKSSNL